MWSVRASHADSHRAGGILYSFSRIPAARASDWKTTGSISPAFLASTRAAQIAEHIYMKRGHAYADEEEDEGEASLFNGLPSSGAAPMSMLTHPSSVSRLWSHTHWCPSRRSQWVS